MKKENVLFKRFVEIFSINRFSYFWFILLCLLVQQAVVASSSVWLTRFSRNLQLGHFDSSNLLLFSFSLLFPYIPGALSLGLLKKWEIHSQSNFWRKYILLWKDRIDLWNNKERKQTQSSLVTKEAPQLISETNRLVFDLFSTGLNVVLNLIIISTLFDIKIFFSFIAGALILIVGTLVTKNKNQKIASEYEKEKTVLSSWLSILWDNLTIGNGINFYHWQNIFEARKFQLKAKTMEFCLSQEVTSTFISMLGFIPTVGLIIFYSFENLNHPQELVPFVVLFPRIFGLLNVTTTLVFLLRSSYGYSGRWCYLLNEMRAPQAHNLEQRISMNKIRVDQVPAELSRPGDILELINGKGQRLTIRGDNGAGKSTLLYWLKNELGEDSCYLPHQSNLVFQDCDEQKSTGQRMRFQLNELLNTTKAKIILLDEWDANLDSSSIRETSRLIDEIAQFKTVVEVRHRL